MTKIFLFALKWITNEKETGAELTFEKTSGNVTEDREKLTIADEHVLSNDPKSLSES